MVEARKPAALTIHFVKERQTKNAIRYSEIATHFVGILYVQKETFNGGVFPERLTITLTAP